MREDTEPVEFDLTIHESALTAVIRTGLSLLGILGILGLIAFLPGLTDAVPDPLTLSTLLTAIATVSLIAALATLTPELRSILTNSIHGPSHLVTDIDRAVMDGLVFLAVLVTYHGLAPAITPFFSGQTRWLYDAIFALAALIPLVLLTYTLHANLETVTDILTARAHNYLPTDEPGPADTRPNH